MTPINDPFIQSQSPKAPYIVIVEWDCSDGLLYAVTPGVDDAVIQDQVVIHRELPLHNAQVYWNASGTKAVCVDGDDILAVFDFQSEITHIRNVNVPTINGAKWKRQTLTVDAELTQEFKLDRYQKNQLDCAIASSKKNDTQMSRLALYKELLRSNVFVPITSDNPTDPSAMIYTFPNHAVADVNNPGNLVCAFTTNAQFDEQVGQFGIGVQKLSADHLCFQANQFDNILGITVTNVDGDTILITRDEFRLLSLISKPQRMNTDDLLTELGTVFFKAVESPSKTVIEYVKTTIRAFDCVKNVYYCRPTVGSTDPLLCIIVDAITPMSESFNALRNELRVSPLHSDCDCYVFSTGDIIAKSLKQSMAPLHG